MIFFVSREAILILTRLECRIHLGELCIRKYSLHGIIVACRQRIKLVIMTTGALQCVAKKHLPDRVGHIIKEKLPRHRRHRHARLLPGPHAQEAHRDEVLHIFCIQFIARNLLAHKLVVRLIRIKGANDIVAIAPGIRPLEVIGKTTTIRIAHHIQPMPPPLLTVMRGCQQPLNETLISIRFDIVHERFNLFRCRWQTSEIKSRSPNKSQ